MLSSYRKRAILIKLAQLTTAPPAQGPLEKGIARKLKKFDLFKKEIDPKEQPDIPMWARKGLGYKPPGPTKSFTQDMMKKIFGRGTGAGQVGVSGGKKQAWGGGQGQKQVATPVVKGINPKWKPAKGWTDRSWDESVPGHVENVGGGAPK